jgi:hypothetical protein
MTDIQIICRFLSPACSAFVMRTRKEWAAYTKNPRDKAHKGCLKRDAIRCRLENIAYTRHLESLK